MSTFERQPESLATIADRDPMFSHDETGKPIVRERICECGHRFTQRLLSERFLAIVERKGAKAMDLMRRDIPDFFVPKHCPPCERRDLGRHARMHEARQELPPHVGEAAD